jgi:transcription elongation factor GreB
MKTYLTPEAYARMRAELAKLLSEERPTIVRAVTEAAAMGDRSENAEYIYGKRRLREIDRRIRFLQKRLDNVEVIDPKLLSSGKVVFGLMVTVEAEDGGRQTYQIVGQDEIDPGRGRITFNSPVGKALLGKKVGDVVKIQRPKGDAELEIIEIRVPESDSDNETNTD